MCYARFLEDETNSGSPRKQEISFLQIGPKMSSDPYKRSGVCLFKFAIETNAGKPISGG